MPNNNNRINFQVGYNVDQASVNAVKKSLQDLQNIKFKDFNGPKQDLDDIKQKASQVEAALNKAFNVNLNSLNTQAFNTELQKAGLSIDKIYTSFSKAGAQGQVAFSRMASLVLTTNMQLKLTNSLVSQMGETMANTVKWGIASSVMNNFTNSVRQAFDYVKALDSSLNDIRIVTKQSSELMANFAVQANNSAQALGRSTMDYTKAALTFYQQGLDEASVQARTESVLKAQNITGAGLEMADYLTAVWNGYKVANEEAELYVDKLAAVADSSASNMSLLAIAMSKVASSANLLGVPVDNLNAQIATIVATTRQAPESVGNALKTIYSRINDIATGADDAEISLGNYSSKMALVGINVLDANGRLRDTGDVIDEIGGKWETLSHEQQIYLARTMAGQRQYNNLLALFENWGKYSDLVNVSMEAQGTTALKNAIYMESLAAKMEQLGAAGERVKSALIDEDDLKGLVSFGTGIVNTFGTLIESIGGGRTAILALGSIFTQVFSGTIAKLLNNIVTHFQDVRNNAEILKQSIASTLLLGKSQGYQSGAIKEMVDAKREIASYYSIISALQLKSYNAIIQEIGANKDQVLVLELQVKLGEKYKEAIEQTALKQGLDFSSQLDDASAAIVELTEDFNNFNTAKKALADEGSGLDKLFEDVINLSSAVGLKAIPNFELMKKIYLLLANNPLLNLTSLDTINKTARLVELIRQAKQLASTGVEATWNLDSLQASLDQANAKLQESINRTKLFQAAMQQFGNIKGIVDTASAIGRLASGLSSIKSLGKIWTDENLSGGEKLLKTITNLGMTIPMLVSAFKTLKTTTAALSASMINQEAVAKGLQTVKEAELILSLKTAIVNLLAAKAAQGDAAAQTALTGAKTAQIGATKALTAAQEELNIAMSANPIGAIITGITLAVTALYGLVQVYDHFTMSVLEANQAIDAFNQKQQLINTNTATYNEQASNLESLKNLYELLAQKAGAVNFDATIDNLTLSERSRYNLIKNIIGQYNEDAIAGYNAQGLAILKNNISLGLQISLLRQKRQEEIDSYTSSQLFEDVKTGYQKLAESALNDLTNYEDTTVNTWSDNYNQRLGLISSQLNQLNVEAGQYQNLVDSIRTTLSVLLSLGFDAFRESQADYEYLKASIKGLETVIEQTGTDRNIVDQIYDIFGYIEEIPIDEITVAENTYKEKIEEAIKMPAEVILLELQSGEYNTQYNALVLQYGLAMANSLIRSYIEGANNGEGFTYKNTLNITAAVLQINTQLAGALSKLTLSDDDFKKIADFNLQDFGNLVQSLYKESVENTIREITLANKGLEELAIHQPLVYEALIKSLFGLDLFSIGTNLQRGLWWVNGFVNDTTKAYDEAKAKVEKYFILNPIDYSSVRKNRTKDTSKLSRMSGEDLEADIQSAVESAKIIDLAILLLYLNSSFNVDLLDNVDLFILYLGKIGVEGGNVKQALDQAAEATRNYVSTMDNISTFDLLQQANTGDLSDLQFGQLSTELDTLVEKQLIAGDTADILKNKWIQGTDIYKQALGEVSNILLNEFQQALQADPSSLQEISGSLKNLITNIQTLYQAQSMGILTQEDWYESLLRLGSQYDSCKEELNDFTNALISGDELAKMQAAALLLLAIQAEETGQALNLISIDSDINEDEWEDLTLYLNLYGELLEGISLHVELHKEAAELLAEAMLRYDHALELVASHYEDWLSALTSGSIQDAVQAGNELQNVYADLLDLPYLNLSPDFTQSIDNLHLLQEAANGSEEAYNQLMQAAQLDILAQAHISLDDTDFWNAKSLVQSAMDLMNFSLILIGANLDTGNFLNALSDMVTAAGMTAQQATDYLSSMGIDAVVKEQDNEATETQQITGYHGLPITTHVPYDFVYMQGTSLGHYMGSITVPGVSYVPDVQTVQGTKENKAFALEVTSAHKKSGGNFKFQNASHGGGSKGGGKKSGGGGGGGGKKASPATQAKISTSSIDTKAKVSTPNPYLQEEKAYLRQSKVLDELQNKLKKLVNKDRLKNLQEQNKVLEKQKDILQKELAISANEAAENSTANYANRLKLAFKNIGFDADGQISDINAIQAENAKVYNLAAQAAADAFEKEKQNYNNYILNVWNKYATKLLQLAHKGEKDLWDERVKNALKAANDSIKAAEEVYKEREDLIKSYNDAWKDDQKRLEDYNKLTDLIYDNLIAISKIKVDLSIDTGDFERDWLDFEKKFIKKLDKNDFLGSAKASAKELMSYFNSNQVQLTANQIKKIRDLIAIMNAGAVSSIYGTNLAQAKEDLEEYMSQQMKDLLKVQDMVDDIKDNYLDAIDNAKDKMDEQIDQYERVNDLIDHNVKMVELLYGDKAYDSMNKYYNLQKTNNERELESLKKQQDYWQSRMNNEVVGSEAWEKFKKNLDDVTDSLNDKLEDMIDNLAKQFENRVNGIIDRLNNALTGGRGLDFLDEQWDYISNYDDNFLDTFETKTGIEEVERLYQSLIDALAGSPKSQQKLNKLMNDQLKLLREKDHLTEYDLERAKASLEVEKARLALEEARDRKTKMRLRRDSQGNYTYQYVADELKLGDLQAALADAQANLYNTDKLHYKQNLNTLYDTYKEYIEKMRDLTAEYNATQDEEERKRIQGRIDLLKESTAKLMSGLTEDNKYLLNYLNGSYFDGMGTDTSTLTMEEQMEIMKENIPYMQSLIQDLSDTIVGESGILPATANMIKEINAATVEYDKNVKSTLATAGTSLQTIELAINSEGNALDKNIINAQKLITANDELIKSCQAQIEAMEQLLDYMDKYLSKIMSVETLLNNLRSAYNTGQGLNSSNLTADNINMTNWGMDTTAGAEYTGNPATDAAAIKRQIDALMAQYLKFLQGMSIATFDTGGYTGSWADASGRLAFLHQGELVLNQDDTKNILNAVQLVRGMASSINSFVNGELGSLMSGAVGLLSGISNTEQLDQNVHIEANFPNVTQHTEIEQAFENLVNMASMRASKYRD